MPKKKRANHEAEERRTKHRSTSTSASNDENDLNGSAATSASSTPSPPGSRLAGLTRVVKSNTSSSYYDSVLVSFNSYGTLVAVRKNSNPKAAAYVLGLTNDIVRSLTTGESDSIRVAYQHEGLDVKTNGFVSYAHFIFPCVTTSRSVDDVLSVVRDVCSAHDQKMAAAANNNGRTLTHRVERVLGWPLCRFMAENDVAKIVRNIAESFDNLGHATLDEALSEMSAIDEREHEFCVGEPTLREALDNYALTKDKQLTTAASFNP